MAKTIGDTIDRKALYGMYGGRCAFCGRSMSILHMRDVEVPASADSASAAVLPVCVTCATRVGEIGIDGFREQIRVDSARVPKARGSYKVGVPYGFYAGTPSGFRFYFEEHEPG